MKTPPPKESQCGEIEKGRQSSNGQRDSSTEVTTTRQVQSQNFPEFLRLDVENAEGWGVKRASGHFSQPWSRESLKCSGRFCTSDRF